MSRTCRIFALLAAVLLAGSVAWAQSSGNFSAAIENTACVIDTSAGTISGGDCVASANTAGCLIMSTPIKTSSGSGVSLLITPSEVTGLFTSTKDIADTTSTAQIGIQVCITVDGSSTGVQPTVSDGCVVYDERFQQVSSNFLNNLSSSAFIQLIISTLSAHSFNFVAQVPNGQHTVTATWNIVDVQAVNNASVGACVGPGTLTVTQTKIFNNSGTLSF
jgi:hypothetical protein